MRALRVLFAAFVAALCITGQALAGGLAEGPLLGTPNRVTLPQYVAAKIMSVTPVETWGTGYQSQIVTINNGHDKWHHVGRYRFFDGSDFVVEVPSLSQVSRINTAATIWPDGTNTGYQFIIGTNNGLFKSIDGFNWTELKYADWRGQPTSFGNVQRVLAFRGRLWSFGHITADSANLSDWHIQPVEWGQVALVQPNPVTGAIRVVGQDDSGGDWQIIFALDPDGVMRGSGWSGSSNLSYYASLVQDGLAWYAVEPQAGGNILVSHDLEQSFQLSGHVIAANSQLAVTGFGLVAFSGNLIEIHVPGTGWIDWLSVAVDTTVRPVRFGQTIDFVNRDGELYELPVSYGRKEVPVTAPAFRPGDVNQDGYLTIVDAVLVLKGVTHQGDVLSQQANKLADINGDGLVTVVDAVLILKAVVGINPDNTKDGRG